MGSHLNSNLDRKRNMRWQFAQRPYPPHALPTTGPRNDVCTNDSAFYDLLNDILKSLVLFQGSDLEKNQGCLVGWPTLQPPWANESEIPEVIQVIQASYQASGSHIVGLWTALIESKSSSTGIPLVTSAQLAVGTSTRGTPIIF